MINKAQYPYRFTTSAINLSRTACARQRREIAFLATDGFGQTDEANHFPRLLPASLLGYSAHLQAELDIRQSRAPGKGGFFLKDHAEPRVWAVNSFIAYVQFAIRCRNQSLTASICR